MENRNMGAEIARLRKAKGMTQLELAEQMGVTDKAVSKWERNVACPDVHSLPKLAEILDVTVDELMLEKTPKANVPKNGNIRLKRMIFRAVALAMGVALVVLSVLGQLDTDDGLGLAGVAIVSLSLHAFLEAEEKEEA